jgi:DNA-binding winged helix-turn-helix (wHTH) protein
LIFLRVGASFRHEKRKSTASSLALCENRVRLRFDDYVLDVARRELRRGAEPVAVEPQVFDLLLYFVQNPERVVSKDELLQVVWDGRIVSDSAITNRINAARRTIGDSGKAQHLIRTVPRKGFRFIGAIEELADEPSQAAVPQHPSRRRGIASTFIVVAASALLGAALATFLTWPTASPRWLLAARPASGRAPITASAGDLRLISRLPLPAPGNGADQLSSPAGLSDVATGLPRAQSLLVIPRGTAPVGLNKATADASIESSAQQRLAVDVATAAPPAPSVTVTAPRAPVTALYPREAAKPLERISYTGRYRVDENKFPEVPCTATRIASSAGGKCLLGYRGLGCNKAIDVVMYNIGSLSIEASSLIFDPYKLTATGFATRCYVAGHPAYDQQDFQDMNQVTRRGSNWHNFLSNGEDKSIEFSDGPHNCVAVHKPGPPWQGGYVYMLHVSICRTDTAAVRTEDITYALNLLQIRQDDPVTNLRTAGK